LLVGFLLLFYAVFLGLMTITENQWLGSPPFHEAIDVRSQTPHEFTLVDAGPQALAQRLRLIRSAQHSLDLEYFIYELDTSSRIVARALVDRAQAGVKVRILVDFSLPIFALRPAYAQELSQAGVMVRYYNTSSVARFFSVQHRTHRKLLVVDGQRALVGGRNIADAYFDLADEYNFFDSDVIVEGEIVGAIAESFDLYWESPWAVEPPAQDLRGPRAQVLLASSTADQQVLAHLAQLPAQLPSHQCPRVRFVTDYPGAGVQYRRVFSAIADVLAGARQRVVAESPYFVLRADGLQELQRLADRGVTIDVLTNSLHSTDAFYTVAPLYFSLAPLAMPQVSLYAYAGGRQKPAQADAMPTSFVGSQRWGVHSKRAVVDDDTIMIGTYNIDPRSANLNSELIVVCQGSQGLASQMLADVHARMTRSHQVVIDGRVQRANLLGEAGWQSQLLMWLVAPISSVFNFLL